MKAINDPDVTRSTYTGNRVETDVLIKWLLDQGYWFEVAKNRVYREPHFNIVCGVHAKYLPWKSLGITQE